MHRWVGDGCVGIGLDWLLSKDDPKPWTISLISPINTKDLFKPYKPETSKIPSLLPTEPQKAEHNMSLQRLTKSCVIA